jgi:hypothetical protein
LLPIEIHQRFVNSAQADADPGMVAELVADCGPGRERTVFEEVRVVFNGGHSTMGNWGKMDERFKYLSRERRWAFYATNCGNNGWGRSTVRACLALVLDIPGRMLA